MTDGRMQAVLAIWAARGLPARLDVTATANLPGFAEHDIEILMAVGRLTPLGDPAPNAPKWFAAVETIRFAAGKEWLHKAMTEISNTGGRSASAYEYSAPDTPSSQINAVLCNYSEASEDLLGPVF